MKITLIFILLLSILNDAQLKQNILSQIEDVEDPILTANSSTFKAESAKAIKNLLGISYNFDTKIFERTYVLHSNPRITAKLSSSCKSSITLGYTSGYIRLKGGEVVSQMGTQIKLGRKSIDLLEKSLNANFSKMMDILTQKLKDAVVDGDIYFDFSLTGVKIEIIFDTKGKAVCDGKLIIGILPLVNAYLNIESQAFSKKEFENIFQEIEHAGAVAVGTVILFKMFKDAGLSYGGPIGKLIGVSS
jgi:uncharacterized protein (UPF0147 family)